MSRSLTLFINATNKLSANTTVGSLPALSVVTCNTTTHSSITSKQSSVRHASGQAPIRLLLHGPSVVTGEGWRGARCLSTGCSQRKAARPELQPEEQPPLKEFSEIPGPRKLPIVNNVFSILFNKG